MTELQSIAVILKFFLFIDIVVEAILYGVEIYLMHNLEKQGLGKVGFYNEKERRQKFSGKFRNFTLFWIFLFIGGIVAV